MQSSLLSFNNWPSLVHQTTVQPCVFSSPQLLGTAPIQSTFDLKPLSQSNTFDASNSYAMTQFQPTFDFSQSYAMTQFQPTFDFSQSYAISQFQPSLDFKPFEYSRHSNQNVDPIIQSDFAFFMPTTVCQSSPSLDNANNVIFQSIACPQQQALSCVFHSIKNAQRMQETNGQTTISFQEGQQIDQAYPQLKEQLQNPAICYVCSFEKKGGIALEPYNTPIQSNQHFMNALNQLKMTQKSFACIVIFQSHAVALHISKNMNGQLVFKVADSDSPHTMHSNTQKVLNFIAGRVSSIFHSNFSHNTSFLSHLYL